MDRFIEKYHKQEQRQQNSLKSNMDRFIVDIAKLKPNYGMFKIQYG